MDYSTKQTNEELLAEIHDALKNVRGWGSVEIYIQDYKVVQITERRIKKTTTRTSDRVGVKIGA